jgi:hypothetical protein
LVTGETAELRVDSSELRGRTRCARVFRNIKL